MKKDIAALLFNIFILVCIFSLLTFSTPAMTNAFASTAVSIMKITTPSLILRDMQEAFASYNPSIEENTNTTTSSDASPVMNSIGAKDRKDDTDIARTPEDIEQMMNEAKETINQEEPIGKTSEEAYQGGGTIISYGDLEIQSKIPFSVYYPNIEDLLNQGSDLVIRDKSKPTILIYHSHTTEAFTLLDAGCYYKSDASSKDPSRNMIRVGDDLASYLEAAGFSVIHDTNIYDYDYNNSYANSRVAVERYLEEYPSIEVTIDLHRDDITYSNKTKVKPTAVINGKKAARMMLISGCEYNRVKNFPDWEDNLRFDLQVQNKVNKMYPGLMRPILFSERKYNMYETHYSFLLEVGTDANTLDEACYSARMFGRALGELLNERYVKD